MLAQQRAAGFRILLAAALADMEHKAEGHRQHQIEAPGDEAPMEQGVHPRPVLNRPHFRQMGVRGVKHPLGEGIEENIRCQAAGEHHGAPGEEGIFRLFIGLSQNDLAVLGEGQEQGQSENTQADDEIIQAEGVPEKEPDLAQDRIGLLRQEEKQHTQG